MTAARRPCSPGYAEPCEASFLHDLLVNYSEGIPCAQAVTIGVARIAASHAA